MFENKVYGSNDAWIPNKFIIGMSEKPCYFTYQNYKLYKFNKNIRHTHFEFFLRLEDSLRHIFIEYKTAENKTQKHKK